MVIAVVFAGGTGSRMNSKSKPKQFLELHGKPIIIHTLEYFENHDEVDAIAVVCKDGWMEYLSDQIKRNYIEKVKWCVGGGKTGQLSIYNALNAINNDYPDNDDIIVMIHDGVRPLITEQLITDCIECVKINGNAITVTKAKETIAIIDEKGVINEITNREMTKVAKAPQCFYLNEILEAHNTALKDGIDNGIDSASLMMRCGHKLYTVNGPDENIKITTASDFYIFRAIYEARENSQIWGY